MPIKQVVDLARVNILAAADDHVGLAIGDVKKTVGVAVADIAGVKPTAAKCFLRRLRIFVIALENIRPAKDDLAELAVRNFLIVFVEYFKLGTYRLSA